jgi:VanZ family protein
MHTDARRIAVFAAVTAIVVTSSLVPVPTAPDQAPTGDTMPPGTDKLVHAVGYAAVAYTLGRALPQRRGGDRAVESLVAVIGVAAASTALGAGVEVAQGVVPGRDPSTLDSVANGVGAVAGALAVRWRVGGAARADEL